MFGPDQYVAYAKQTKVRDNLAKRERRALKRLIRRQDIIIKPVDKGWGTGVMDMDSGTKMNASDNLMTHNSMKKWTRAFSHD